MLFLVLCLLAILLLISGGFTFLAHGAVWVIVVLLVLALLFGSWGGWGYYRGRPGPPPL